VSEPDYSLRVWGEFKRSLRDTWRILRPLLNIGFVLLVLFLIAGVFLGPIAPRLPKSPASACMQRTRSLNLLLFSYANDHEGTYADGKSSTEVFQKLLDQKYCKDSSIFYIPFPGKKPPVPGQKLKPENVSFDVTSGVDANSPENLPIVFMTGYKVDYAPGSSAIPIIKPFPNFGWEESPGFIEWLTGWRWRTIQYSGLGGLGVAYKSNNASFLRLETSAKGAEFVQNFIPSDFKPDGKTYIQLTPNGPLP